MDILIKNVKLFDSGEIVDVALENGVIIDIKSTINSIARNVIEARNCIISPGFVDPHVHLDKCLTMDQLSNRGSLDTTADMILAQRESKTKFSPQDVRSRATRAIQMAVANGTTWIRTYVEADPLVDYQAVDGILEAKEDCIGLVDIKTIAFPQEGWIQSTDGREMGGRDYIIGAMQRGADLVGGNVNRAIWDSDPQKQVDDLFEIAIKFDTDLAIHLDNAYSAAAFTLPYVAKKTIENNYQGRVSVAHIVSLALVPDRVAHQTIDLVAQADINVCILPNVIRLTRVKELFEAGINVMVGTDNLRDAFMHIGHGDADMLKAMLLLAQIINFGFDDELNMIYRAGTVNAAKGLRLTQYGIQEGHPADLVIIEAESVPDAIRSISRRRAVIKKGNIVAEYGQVTTNPPSM